MARTTTLILGGGPGGISAANTLRKLLPSEHEIVLVDKSPRFHVGAGKTWIMLGERTARDISALRQNLIAPGIRFMQERVLRIDPANQNAALERETLKWDCLVIALGASLNMDAVPGLAGAAHTFYTLEGAERLGSALERFTEGDLAILIPKAPFKCPPAPYEAAMLLHEAFARRGLTDKVRIAVHTVEGAPMATAGPEMGAYIQQELAQRGIGFHPQRKTVGVDAALKRIILEDGSKARYDLLIAIPPHEAPKIASDAQLTNPSGWIPVDPKTLRVTAADTNAPGTGAIYAVGDITSVPLPGRFKPDAPLSLPKAGVFAEAQGRVVAHQIAARTLSQTPSETFDGKGFCYLELGAHRAVRGDGSFFEMPHPEMRRQTPDEVQYREKQEWVASQLRPATV